jgi:hypothetical protein
MKILLLLALLAVPHAAFAAWTITTFDPTTNAGWGNSARLGPSGFVDDFVGVAKVGYWTPGPGFRYFDGFAYESAEPTASAAPASELLIRTGSTSVAIAHERRAVDGASVLRCKRLQQRLPARRPPRRRNLDARSFFRPALGRSHDRHRQDGSRTPPLQHAGRAGVRVARRRRLALGGVRHGQLLRLAAHRPTGAPVRRVRHAFVRIVVRAPRRRRLAADARRRRPLRRRVEARVQRRGPCTNRVRRSSGHVLVDFALCRGGRRRRLELDRRPRLSA